MKFIVLLAMTLSKKNLDQLKSILNKVNTIKHNISDKNSTYRSNSLKKDHPIEANNPDQIFYSIIDNSEHLEDTILSNNKLKKIEENLITQRKYFPINNKIDSQRNNQLSEEDLMYDEFNYLLDE
tara:strand:+ start:276 stop:650 length:375 start_codon:yes stop_codon:yes gene_type:complete